MGLRDQFEKLRNYFVEDEDEDDDDYVEEVPVHEPTPQRVQTAPRSQAQSNPQRPIPAASAASAIRRPVPGSNSGMNSSAYVSSASTSSPASTSVGSQTRVVSQNNMIGNPSNSKITMTVPHVYADIMEMGKMLKSGTTLIVNFKNMADQQARRSIDFLTGVAYILDGDIQNIGGQSFLVTPTGVDVDGAKESLLAQGGSGFESFDLS